MFLKANGKDVKTKFLFTLVLIFFKETDKISYQLLNILF